MDQRYWIALEYQQDLKRCEIYKSSMMKTENHYEGWQSDLASDLICTKRMAREKFQERMALLKNTEVDHGQN